MQGHNVVNRQASQGQVTDRPCLHKRGDYLVKRVAAFTPIKRFVDNFGDLKRAQELSRQTTLLPTRGDVSIQDVIEPVRLDMEKMRDNLIKLAGDRHPTLKAAANQIFGAGGKHMRPALVFLVARATIPMHNLSDLTEKHRRLGEITEMIHVASLVHDDVLDDSDTRRGKQTVNRLFGTRVAVLAGDFLFAQASWYLAQLENIEVIKLISQVIADFADGEISQASKLFDTSITWEQYREKNFWKTASLIAASCRSAAVFSGCTDAEKAAIYEYGKRLGIAFQIVDDILDFTQSAEQLGKPQGQDLASGNITAPTIFALETSPRLRTLLNSKFQNPADLEEALNIVRQSGSIDKARLLASEEGQAAREALVGLPDTPAKQSLLLLVDYVLERLY